MSVQDPNRNFRIKLNFIPEHAEAIRRQLLDLASFQERLLEQYSFLSRSMQHNALQVVAETLANIDTSKFYKAIDVSNNIAAMLKSAAGWQDVYLQRIQEVTRGFDEMYRSIAANLTAIHISFENLVSSEVFEEIFKAIEQNRDAVKAFKAAGWPISPSMPLELRNHVVALYKRNKKQYISRTIMGYYHKNDFGNLRNMVDSWEENPLFAPRMHIIRDALKAHCEGRYTLSVPALLPQIEGILNDYVRTNHLPARVGRIKEVFDAVFADNNGYNLTGWSIADTLHYQLQNSSYVWTDFEQELKRAIKSRRTTRHTVLHGVNPAYNRPIHSLKVLILLDAVNSLKKLELAPTLDDRED